MVVLGKKGMITWLRVIENTEAVFFESLLNRNLFS